MSKAEKNWVVMLYLAADNDLSEEGVWTLTEISKVSLKQDMSVIVLFDSSGIGVDTRVYEFGYEENTLVEKERAAIKYANVISRGIPFAKWVNAEDKEGEIENASSAKLLEKFVSNVKEQYPANNFALILSGHGSGTIGDFLKSGSDKLEGTDFKGMTIPDLAIALKNANLLIQILGMDSCLMSMAEICCELPTTVKYLIGSEGFEPLTGWPYQEILNEIMAAAEKRTDNLSTEGIARIVCDAYIKYYAEYHDSGTSIDIAVSDLDNALKEELRSNVKELGKALIAQMREDEEVRNAVILAHWQAQSYKADQYTDLWDFCDLVAKGLRGEKTIRIACEKVKGAVEKIVKYARYYGTGFQHSHGLSVYFPWRETADLLDYGKVEFADAWADFLKNYVDLTRREKRGESREEPGVYLEKFEFVPSSFSRSEKGIAGIKANAPHSKANAPHSKANAPHSKGLFAAQYSMKNPPNGFLVDSEKREALTKIENDG